MRINVLEFILELNSHALALNDLFREHFDLDDCEELKEEAPFARPIRAVAKRLVPKKGTLHNEKTIDYFFYEGGVSFTTGGLSIGFDYFPVIKPIRQPVFGLLPLFNFIASKGITLSIEDKMKIEDEVNNLAKRGFLSFCFEGYSQYYINSTKTLQANDKKDLPLS